MVDNQVNKNTSKKTWIFFILCAICLPAMAFAGIIYCHIKVENKDSVFTIYWIGLSILTILLPTMINRYCNNWVIIHEKIIGRTFNYVLSYVIPIGIIVSIVILDKNHIDMATSYLIAGFVFYVGLRKQSDYLQNRWKWILPFSILISSVIVGYFNGILVICIGLIISFIVYALGTKRYKKIEDTPPQATSACPGLAIKIRSTIEENKFKGITFCILIRDFLYDWSKMQNEPHNRETILIKIKSLKDCFTDPVSAIVEMTTFSPELMKLYHLYDDKYYNLALIAEIIEKECMDYSREHIYDR